ncbi:hypothetical protein Tco_0206162 [Tanacetum coccineum]
MLEDPYLEAAFQASPSPDYVPGPEEPEHAPPLPDYVPGAEHADDEIVAEDQPYAEDALPIAQSPAYVPESDPEADPEEDDDEDPEKDSIDYPANGGDDGDDEMDIEEDEDDDMDIEADEEDEDDEMDVEIDEEAEEEHLAPAYPVVVALPATAPSAEETEPFETDESAATPPPHPAYRMTARITIPEPLPVPAWSDSEVARLLAISSPPASPLSPWSSSPPQIPFPLSPPSPVLTAPPPSPIRSLGYRAATIRMRAEAAATSHSLPLPPPFILSPTRPDAPPPYPLAPTYLPPLLLPTDVIKRAGPGAGMVVWQIYGFVGHLMDRRFRREPKTDMMDMGITVSWDELLRPYRELQLGTDTESGCTHEVRLSLMVRRDTDEIYTRLDDEQGQRQLLVGRVNMLFRDRRNHAHNVLLMGDEAVCLERLLGMTIDGCGVILLMDRVQVTAYTGTGDAMYRGRLLHISGRARRPAGGLHSLELPGSFCIETNHKMAPKRATRSTPVTTTTAPTATTTTNVTNAQLQAMIDQGVSAALAARDATRNDTDSHSSDRMCQGI